MIARLRERLPAGRRERLALAALALVLAAGAALRLLFMLAQRPALLGYPDTQAYLGGGGAGFFGDVLRPSGYPMFLRAVKQVSDELAFATVVQHGLGLAAAVLLFLAARRAGAGRWWALLPAAALALGGTELFLEHAPLTEGPFAFVQAAAVYAALRAASGERHAWAWGLAAGLLAGYGATVRTFGLGLVPLVVLWLLLAAPARERARRLVPGAAALLGAVLVLGAYVVGQERKTGFTGYTQAGNWNLYGRAATFADCQAFTPPRGTSVLCEKRPPAERESANTYIFSTTDSPAIKAFGVPFYAGRKANERLGAFARAAFLHQPLDWLGLVVTEELPRYWNPDRSFRRGQGLGGDALVEALTSPSAGQAAAIAAKYWDTQGTFLRRGLYNRLVDYEEVTRVRGVLFVVLVVLAGLAPLLARPRRGPLLLFLLTLAGLLGPPLFLYFDARYTVPALGPLAAAAAVGGAALSARIGERRARRAEP